MAGEWSHFTLGQLCGQITDGKHGDCQDQADSGFYFLSVKDVVGNRLLYEGARQITERDFLETHRRTNLEPGDVLFTNTGTIGRMAIAQDDPRTYRTTFQKSVAILKPKRDLIDPHFLYYLLHFDNAKLSDFAAGTTQKNLLLKDLRSFAVRVPPLPVQRAIAQILGTLDDKIELNRRMNATLEAMARALFKSWFVDFDPVQAKAQGRDIGLSREIAELFPDGFEESEVGEVPKGWTVRSLAELFPKDHDCVLTGPFGSNLHAHDYREEGVPLILVKHVNYGHIASDNLPLVGMHKITELERYRLKTADIVFTRVGAVGRSAYVRSQQEGWLISGQTLRVRVPGKSILSPRYLAQVYLEKSFIDMVESHALGTTRPSLNTGLLESFRFLLPPIGIQDLFARIVGSYDSRVQSNLAESRTLAALRDALLPKLISGQVRVHELRPSEESLR
jgi:type I restriction enzyme, S subunit